MTKSAYLIAIISLFSFTSPAPAGADDAVNRTPNASQNASKTAPKPQNSSKTAKKTANLSEKALTQLLKSYFSDASKPANKTLQSADLTFKRVLSTKNLPGGAAIFLEVALSKKDVTLRYPLQIKRADDPASKNWQVSWAPHADYARALAALLKPKTLISSSAEERWEELKRPAALPIIVAKEQFVTPFGALKRSIASQTDKKTETTPKPPDALYQHVKRWLDEALLGDKSAPNIDLLLHQGTTWRDATAALIAPASQGLYRLSFVGEKDAALRSTQAVAPVIKPSSAKKLPVIVAVTQTRAAAPADPPILAVRLRIGDTMIRATKPPSDKNSAPPSASRRRASKRQKRAQACPANMTFCADSPGDFGAEVQSRLPRELRERGATAGHLTLAASGQLPAEYFIQLLDSLAERLGVKPAQIIAGYIGD